MPPHGCSSETADVILTCHGISPAARNHDAAASTPPTRTPEALSARPTVPCSCNSTRGCRRAVMTNELPQPASCPSLIMWASSARCPAASKSSSCRRVTCTSIRSACERPIRSAQALRRPPSRDEVSTEMKAAGFPTDLMHTS